MIISHRITVGKQEFPLFFFFSYPTHSHLHDRIKSSLRRVQVSRDVLLTHQGVELLAVVGQLQDVLVAERAGAVLVARARVQQLGRGGADVRHDGLFHKGAEAFEREEDSEFKSTSGPAKGLTGCWFETVALHSEDNLTPNEFRGQ